MDCAFKHLMVSIELMALFPILEAVVSSLCWASMIGLIFAERNATIAENTGIPTRVTKERFQDV